MFIKNAYAGPTEYVIIFKHGTFHVLSSDDDREKMCGHLEDCEKYVEAKQNEYAESLLF